MFYVFRQQVLPYMVDVFDEDFWAIMIPQASQVYPAVWHGAVATAALRSLMLAKKTSGDMYGYALMHCNMAMQQITKIDPATATPADQEMVLLTCILLICYATLCSNHGAAFTHIHNGLYLSKLWQPEASRQLDCVSTGTSVNVRFRRLESMVLCAPCKLGEPVLRSYRLDERISPDVPFTSSTDAYLELLLIDSEWKKMTRFDGTPVGDMRIRFIVPECEELRVPFRIWRDKFHVFRGNGRHSNKMEEVRRFALDLLDLTLEALTCVDTTRGEEAWDEFAPNFERIVKLGSRMLHEQRNALFAESEKTPNLPRRSQFRSLLALPMVAVGTFCRQADVRRRGIAMLKTLPFLDGLFDSTYFVGFNEEQIRIEEMGLMLDPIEGGCACVFGTFICAAHRVCEAFMSPRSAVLRTGQDVLCDRKGVTVSLAGEQTSTIEET